MGGSAPRGDANGSYGFLWISIDSYGFLWISMDSYGFPMDSYGFPMGLLVT